TPPRAWGRSAPGSPTSRWRRSATPPPRWRPPSTRAEGRVTAGREVVLRAGWAAPGALRALRAGGDGRVAVALREGAYLELPGGCLLLAPPRSPVGPLTLLVDAPARGLRTGAAVVRDGDALRTGGVRIALDRVRPL